MIDAKLKLNKMVVENTHVKTFLITDFPKKAVPGMLYEFNHGEISMPDKRTGEKVSINTMLHVKKANVNFDWKTKIKMDRLQASVESQQTGKLSDAPREEEKSALEVLVSLRDSSSGKSMYVEVFLLVTLSCDNKKVFKRKVRALKHNMKNVWGFKFNELKLEQSKAVKAAWMAGDLELFKDYHGRIMDINSLATFYPFLDGSLSMDNVNSVYIGHRIKDGTAVYKDFSKSPDNQNMLVVGDTGSGKSALIKAIIEGMLAAGMKVYVNDVDGEYMDVCLKYGGEWVDFSMSSGKFVDPTIIEPSLLDELDKSKLSEGDLLKAKQADRARAKEAINLTKGIVSVLIDDFTTKKRNALEFALLKMWRNAGIDRKDPDTWQNRESEVSIHRLYKQIKENAFSENKKILFKDGAYELMEDLWTYFEGGQDDLFMHAQSSEWIKDSQLTVFYIASAVDDGIDNKVGTAKMLMISQMVWQQVKRDRLKKQQFSAGIDDEFQRLVKNPAAKRIAYRDFTTARKFNYQKIAGFNDPTILKDNKGIWNNAKYNMLFSLKKDLIEEIASAGNVPKEVVAEWLNLPEYGFIFREKSNNKEAFDILRAELPDEELELSKTRGLD